MRLGLVAYGTKTGLGYQTAALHQQLQPAKTLLLDLSRHKGMPLHREWFEGGHVRVADGAPRGEDMQWILTDIDLILMCESPLSWDLVTHARNYGIRTVVQYNYEFLDHLRRPELPAPTVWASPSLWNVERLTGPTFGRVWPLPVPVDTDDIPQREVTEARVFGHVGGRPTIADRNGTLDFIETARACADLDARWLLWCQQPTQEVLDAIQGSPVELCGEATRRADMFAEVDVMIRPRRFGGLCLPTQEACAAGIPSVMTDVDPNNRWLPPGWLVPAKPAGVVRAKADVELWSVDRDALEAKVRELHGSPDIVRNMAGEARSLGAGLSWDVMRPVYWAFLRQVMGLRP
jgi:hypothetical protein